MNYLARGWVDYLAFFTPQVDGLSGRRQVLVLKRRNPGYRKSPVRERLTQPGLDRKLQLQAIIETWMDAKKRYEREFGKQ